VTQAPSGPAPTGHPRPGRGRRDNLRLYVDLVGTCDLQAGGAAGPRRHGRHRAGRPGAAQHEQLGAQAFGVVPTTPFLPWTPSLGLGAWKTWCRGAGRARRRPELIETTCPISRTFPSTSRRSVTTTAGRRSFSWPMGSAQSQLPALPHTRPARQHPGPGDGVLLILSPGKAHPCPPGPWRGVVR